MKVPRWAWVAWAILFFVLEAVALVNGIANDTLTETIHHSVPGWLFFMFVGWAVYHFLLTYLTKKDGR